MTNIKSKSKIKKVLSRMFNVRVWIDWSRIKSGGQFISKGASRLFVPSPAHPIESFDEAQRRLKLTDDSLAVRGRSLLRISILMVCLAVALLGYAIYHFTFGTIHSGILSLSLTFLSLAFAFRYHFWYFQISQHKLGCSFHDWFRQGLLGKKI